MTRGYLRLVALLPMLMTFILFFCIQSSFIQPSYASQQEEGVRTLRIKAYLDNIVVEHNNKETIHFQVADHKTHEPIGGAITSATVSYADGKTVRYFSVPTDASGHSSISWRIERNAPDGVYNVVYSVYETGYEPASFGGSFNVVADSVNNGCLSLSSSSSSCSSYSSSSSDSSFSSSSSSDSSSLSPSYSSSSSSSFDPTSLILDIGGPSMQTASSQSTKPIKPFQMDLGGQSMQTASSQSTKPIKPFQMDLGGQSMQTASSQSTKPIKPFQMDLGGQSMQTASSQSTKPIKPFQMDLGGQSMQTASSQPIKPSQK